MRSLYSKALFIILTFLFGFPFFASAATLSVFPGTGSFEEGKTFSVRVTASSPEEAINAASGALEFPTDKLRVVSISKANSFLTLWVQEPAFSNSQGTVSYEGVVPNPGFTGVNGSILAVTFKVVGKGDALVKFTSGALLANDGQGTNIARDLNGASYTLIAAKKVEPVVTPKATEEVPAATVVDQPVSVVESINAPIINDYPKKLEEGTPFKIRGTTYADASVTLSLRDSRGQIFTQIVQSNQVGDFALLWPNKVDRGDYELTGIVTYKGVKSLPSEMVRITIVPTSATNLKFALVDYTSLILVIILCLGLIGALALFFFRGFIHFKKKIWRDASDAEKSVHFEFIELKNAVRKELLVLQSVQTRRELTREESIVLEKINRHIARIEKNIDRKVGEVKKDLK